MARTTIIKCDMCDKDITKLQDNYTLCIDTHAIALGDDDSTHLPEWLIERISDEMTDLCHACGDKVLEVRTIGEEFLDEQVREKLGL